MLKKVTNWIDDSELENIYTSDYWNNIEIEKNKEFYIENGDYEKCLRYLNKNLMKEYLSSEKYIIGFSNKSKLKIADLASGIGWTSALISKLDIVKEVHAVEISKHRIGKLFEECIKMLNGKKDKIYRYLGSFYDLKFEDKSIDILYLSQAFHHADAPLKLLIECDRVLKNNGRIILVGEHFISTKLIIKRFISNLIRKGQINFNFFEMFPPDPVLGDHYYRVSDYIFMFKSLGYSLTYERMNNGNCIYIADKK